MTDMAALVSYFGCESCCTIVRLVGTDQIIKNLILDHPQWKDGWPCVMSGCKTKMHRLDTCAKDSTLIAAKHDLLKIHDLTPEEFFKALCGFGLPEEIDCEPEIVESLLMSSKIIGVVLRQSSSKRTAIDEIRLENGLQLHLAASPSGATVFKITRNREDKSYGAV